MVSDYTNKEMLEAIYEVRDRVTRIEESLKRVEKFEDKLENNIQKTIEAKDLAEDAIALSKQNREQIQSLQTTNRWAWGFVITATLAVVGKFFGLDIG